MIVVANVLVGLGVVFLLLSAVGAVRLPDVFARMHAGSKAATLGLSLVLVGVAIARPEARTALLLAIVFQLVTGPLAAHALGRAAYRNGVPMWDRTAVDELREREPSAADARHEVPYVDDDDGW